MPNPVQIEKLFQDLIFRFNNTASIRHRYHMFKNFSEKLKGEYKRYESYITDIIYELPLYGIPDTWGGIDPDVFESDLELFETLSSALPSVKNRSHTKIITKRLHEVCVLSYCCLNEFDQAEKHLQILAGNSISGLSGFARNTQKSGVQVLSGYLKHLAKKRKGIHSSLQTLDKEARALAEKNPGKVLVPVIEKYTAGEGSTDTYQYGRLRRLTVELYAEAEDNDELSRNFNIYGVESPAYVYKNKILEASRALLNEKTQKLNNRFFKGLISYELTGALHDGDSANLAIAALWFVALQGKNGAREKYILNSSAAVTGDVESDGKVAVVSPQSVSQKTKAAFYSSCEVLVVPQAQKEQFHIEIENLQKKYPSRKLDVVGVKNLRDLFYDRRVTEIARTGLFSHYLRNVLEKTNSPVNLLLIILLLAALIALMHSPVDKNPVSFMFEGNSLVLANRYGVEITRMEVDNETARYQSSQRDIEVNPLVVLTDITGNGQNEVIWATRGSRADERPSIVKAYSLSADSLIWEKELKLNYDFPRQSALFETGLRSNQIGFIETENRNKLVINAGSSLYFQSVIFLLNVENGDIISEYVHTGQLRAMILADLTENGVNEIILTGINNAFWGAVIVVLDVTNAQGYSPLTDEYRPEGLTPADEIVYILVPKTPIGEYLSSIEKYNQGRNLFFDSASRSVWAQIAEGRRYFRDYEEDVYTIIYLDSEMKPVGVGTNDLYDIIARELYEEGAIPFIPGYEYFEEYMDSLLYWNGEDFVPAGEYF
jgi:hypothetical protein